MKPREPRSTVILATRLRHGDAWCDACILNVSSRGLLLHASAPPERGVFVEVRRGAHVVVGRVIWSKDGRFGLQTQDRLSVTTLVKGQRPGSPGGAAVFEQKDRRRRPRSKTDSNASRQFGRLMEFLFVVGLGFVVASGAHDFVTVVLSEPLSMVANRL